MRLSRSPSARIAIVYAALVTLLTGAVCFMAADAAEVTGPIGAAATATFVIGAGSIGLTLWMGRRAARTIRTVTDAARHLANGELDHRIAAPASHESRELAESFNRMADLFQDRMRDLEAEQRLLAVVMETMADGVIALDANNRVRLINRPAQRLLMTDAQATHGRPLAEVVRDFEVLEVATRSAATRQIQHAELELLHQRRFLSVIATPISADIGEGVLLTLQDVTDLRQVQTTRREFVSNVSHELRNPLASVSAMVEILESGAIDDREATLDFLGRIQNDVGRMTALVNELLELSSLESGQMPIHLAPVNLVEVVGVVVERFRLTAAVQEVEIGHCVPADAPYVMAERAKLGQILTNLIENALRFTPRGGRVTLSSSATARWVEIRVADSGVGIPREHLPHVFERFYKVDRSRSDGGTGLGLAIVKHLVQAHGGDVTAASAEGEGSVFTLTLRRAT